MAASKENRSAKLIRGAIAPTLIKMALPMIIAISGMLVFNLTDTYFIGRLGKGPLAALTFTFPVIMVFTSLALGIGTGASAVISRAIGEGNHHKVQQLTTNALLLILLIAVVAITAGLLTMEPLFKMLGAHGQILSDVKLYMYIWYSGVLFVMVPMVGNNAIRATGDTKTPSMVMLIAAGINLGLDPIFIFGYGPVPAMGIEGAAWATLFARMITLVAALYILIHREKMLSFERQPLLEIWLSFKQIMKIGVPTAGARMLLPIGTGVITRIISAYGVGAVAAYGVGSRLDFFAIAPMMAISAVIGPFVGQNAGAGFYDRIQKAVKGSSLYIVVWGGIMWGIYFLFAPTLIKLFNSDPNVVKTGVLYLSIAPAAYAFVGLLQIGGTVLNVLDRPLHASGINLLQMFFIYIPLAFLLKIYLGLTGVFSAYVFSYFCTGLIASFYTRRIIRRHLIE